MLDVCHIQAIRCPRRRADGCKTERCDHVATNSVVLVDALRIVDAAVQIGGVVLSEANDSLDIYQDVECQSEDRVRRLEVLVTRTGFVKLDDDETSGEGGGAEDVEEEVGDRARALLLGSMGRLQDESGLYGEEETGGVQELGVTISGCLVESVVTAYGMGREEDQLL